MLNLGAFVEFKKMFILFIIIRVAVVPGYNKGKSTQQTFVIFHNTC